MDSPGFLTSEQFDARDYNNVSDPTDGGYKRHALERASLRVVVRPDVAWRTTTYATQGSWDFFLTVPPEPGAGEGSGSQTEEHDLRNGWGATSALTYVHDRVELTVGTEGRLDYTNFTRRFTTHRVVDSTDAAIAAHQASGALFVQSSFDIGHHVRFTAGGRYDVLDTHSDPKDGTPSSASHGILSPKFGALVHVPRIGDLYANVSRGFRSTDGVIEDPTLPFITEWAYEGGVHVDAGRVTGGAALFQTDVSNEQTFNPILLESVSGGRSRRRGVEVSLAAPLGEFVRLNGTWTITDARYRDQVTSDGDNLAGLRVANTSRYVGSVAVDLGPTASAFAVRLSTNVVGPYTPFDDAGTELPAYALVHASARWILGGRTTLRLGVRNLFNTAYPELRAGGFVTPGQTRSVYGGVGYVM